MLHKRWFIYLVALLIVGLGSAYFLRSQISLYLVKNVASERLANKTIAQLPDGLHIGFCGAGSPFPDEKRTGPCTLVIAGKDLFVFDAGNTSSRNINNLFHLNTGDIKGIFLTHFHSDHIDGLGELLLQRWVAGSHANPVPVYGPPGTEQVLKGFMDAYRLDQGYRVAHHGAEYVPPSGFGGIAHTIPIPNAGRRHTVIQTPELKIEAFEVDHSPSHPAYGYKITYKDRSVVLSGDTKKMAVIAEHAKGADVLIHEALSPELVAIITQAATHAGRKNLAKVSQDILDYHTTPEEAAQLASQAQVSLLALNHITPPLPLPGMDKVFLGKAPDLFKGKILVTQDGDFITLPSGSKNVTIN